MYNIVYYSHRLYTMSSFPRNMIRLNCFLAYKNEMEIYFNNNKNREYFCKRRRKSNMECYKLKCLFLKNNVLNETETGSSEQINEFRIRYDCISYIFFTKP